MPHDVQPYLRAIEERIGFQLDEPFDSAYEFVVDDKQNVAVTLDADAGSVRIVTMVDNTSNRLSRDLLMRLLEFNFPNNSTAGATLCALNGASNLKLVNQFALAAVTPNELAETAVAQGRAALGLTKWIVEQRAHDA
jgi:hypothetical protein